MERELRAELNPHTEAGVLKMWLRELATPLIIEDMYDVFLASIETADENVQELMHNVKYLRALRSCCALLPTAERDTLRELLSLMRTTDKLEDENPMGLRIWQ